MVENEKVSVIMSCYNCSKTLEKAIDSILAQTYTNWVMICCDDASKDNTLNILKEYQRRYPDKFVIIKNERNKKLPYSLNHCLKYVKTELIARMDADDWSMPERFEKQVTFLCEHPEYDLVGTGVQVFADNEILTTIIQPLVPVPEDMLHCNCFSHATIMTYKRVYIRGLLEAGYQVTLLSADGRDYKIDSSMKIPDEVTTYTIYGVSLYEKMSLKKRNSKNNVWSSEKYNSKKLSINNVVHKGISKMKELVLALYGAHGIYSTFVHKAQKFELDENFDYVISISTPVASHLLTYNLLKSEHIKGNHWIQIYLISHSEVDIEICRELKNKFEQEAHVIFVDRELNCLEFSEIIKQFEFVIASRFHSIVHAFRNGIPCIALGWATKYYELMKMFDQEQYMVDLRHEIKVDELEETIDSMILEREEVSLTIKERLEELRDNNVFEAIKL